MRDRAACDVYRFKLRQKQSAPDEYCTMLEVYGIFRIVRNSLHICHASGAVSFRNLKRVEIPRACIDKGTARINNMAKRALIIVDVQNDFCPGGTLAVKDGDQVVGPLNKLIREFERTGDPIFKSRDWHPATTKHFQKFGGTWPVHCVQNTRGAEFHPDLIDSDRITIISKGLGDEDSYSAFDGTKLEAMLQELCVEELIIGGLATDYCVKQTVLDGLKNGFKVKAVSEAMRAVEAEPGDGEKAIEEMKAAGAEIA